VRDENTDKRREFTKSRVNTSSIANPLDKATIIGVEVGNIINNKATTAKYLKAVSSLFNQDTPMANQFLRNHMELF
jgi:hypothetical protein